MNERAIFDAAVEISDPAQQQAYLAQACGNHADLRKRVEGLLKSHAAAGSFLDIPALDQLRPSAPSHGLNLPPDRTLDYAQSPEAVASNPDDNDEDQSHVDLGFLQPPTKPNSLGRLGHYEVLQVLGQGAFGIVLKAFDEKLHRHVAIKVMNPQMAATSPPRKRFLREARAAAAIRHENIVQVYSVEEQPLPYLVMEYIAGQTLQQKLDTAGPLGASEVLHLGRQIASGLEAAHALGLVHRDVKPGNILLEEGAEQKVKITDFGLARAADDASLTRTGIVSGTPMYMAPEQALGQAMDHRADLFSLGSVLYQMACGRPPFRAATMVAVLRRVAEDTPRPLQEILPEIPAWLVAIVNKLLAKNPGDRFQSAKEVAQLLARCQLELQQNGRVSAVNIPPVVPVTAEVLAPQKYLVEREYDFAKPIPADSAPPASNYLLWLLIGAFPLMCIFGLMLLLAYFRASSTIYFPTQEAAELAEPIPVESKTSSGWQGWPAAAPPPAIAPFDAAQAKQHQQAWAKYLNVPVEYTNSIGMKFVLIPPGEFLMGSTEMEVKLALDQVIDENWRECIHSEGPQHKVIVTQPFYLGLTEVTQAQYEQVQGKNPSHFTPTGLGKEFVAGMQTTDHPVETVSWHDAAEFCAKLSQLEKYKPDYFRSGETITPLAGTGYRLPSEAEWELACRAGTTTKYWIGERDEMLVGTGWYSANARGRSHAVGELKPNPFGLFDVHGNVFEWAQDQWRPNSYSLFLNQSKTNPASPISTGLPHVFRGGGWYDTSTYCRSSHRLAFPEFRGSSIGFRAALPVAAVRQALQSTAKPGEGWQQLFNGRDLTGWMTHPDEPGDWKVEEGVLSGGTSPAYLYSEQADFTHFHLRFEVSISEGGDSGVLIHSPFNRATKEGLDGYEAQIQSGSLLVDGWATGAIACSNPTQGWQLLQPAKSSLKPDEWTAMEIIVRGNQIETHLAGQLVATYTDSSNRFPQGRIVLQQSGANTRVKFRNMEVQRLTPPTSPNYLPGTP